MKTQGFIPNACFESESEEWSDDYETDTEYETDDDDTNNQYQTSKKHNQLIDCNINSNTDHYYKILQKYKIPFVVEDPFIEVKDEQIECTDESSTEEDFQKYFISKMDIPFVEILEKSGDAVLVASQVHLWRGKVQNSIL